MKVAHQTLAIARFVVVHPGLAIAQGGVQQEREIARGGSHCLGFADAAGQPTIEGPQRGLRSPDDIGS